MSSRAKSSSSTRRGLRSIKPFVPKDHLGFCIFEYVYFARPDSVLEGVNVSHVRTNMGRELARLHPVEADLIIPVPDSGNYAALGFSEESGIPYDAAFVRNHYVGRTFLNPSQLAREFGVKVKLNIIKERVKGKRVVVVDDSIVRGTTARSRVMNLRNAGAKEVHIRISCPPHRFPCHYGIDFPDPKDLIANQLSLQEITKYLQADSLGYLDEAGMVRATGRGENKFCMACFNQKYPVAVNPELDKLVFERRRARADSLVFGEDISPRLFNGNGNGGERQGLNAQPSCSCSGCRSAVAVTAVRRSRPLVPKFHLGTQLSRATLLLSHVSPSGIGNEIASACAFPNKISEREKIIEHVAVVAIVARKLLKRLTLPSAPAAVSSRAGDAVGRRGRRGNGSRSCARGG